MTNFFRGWSRANSIAAPARAPFDARRTWRRVFVVLKMVRMLRLLGARAASRRAFLEKQHQAMYGAGHQPRCATPGCGSDWYYVQKNGHCTSCNANRTRQTFMDFNMMDTIRKAWSRLTFRKPKDEAHAGLTDEEYAMMLGVEWSAQPQAHHPNNLKLLFNLAQFPPHDVSQSNINADMVDELVKHSALCRAAEQGQMCPVGGCAAMSRILEHTAAHPNAEPNCTDCLKAYRILMSHAERCQAAVCGVPRCTGVKLHLETRTAAAPTPQMCWVRTPTMSWWPAIAYPLHYPLSQLPLYVVDQYQEGFQIVCSLGDRQFACLPQSQILPWTNQPAASAASEPLCNHLACEDLRGCVGYAAACVFASLEQQKMAMNMLASAAASSALQIPQPQQVPRTRLPSLPSLLARQPQAAMPNEFEGAFVSPEVHMKKRKLIQAVPQPRS
ncbi:Aste57867_25475 [Aphanomyces stellatus]|uniref:Aste57867_25475 protein n=1 Tax=Aphanomyces stellatus TaxID=120398 RepID=A0A485LTW2_9STRA|nr:hypothetical protein As57867_025396 [Aphanomyces stellatus]VFU02098.1 Aste57867_25475 [Aphanomyces stellatus]